MIAKTYRGSCWRNERWASDSDPVLLGLVTVDGVKLMLEIFHEETSVFTGREYLPLRVTYPTGENRRLGRVC